MPWLLESSLKSRFEKLEQEGFTPNAEQYAKFTAFEGSVSSGSQNRLLSIEGNIAFISIEGVMTRKPSFLALLFGGGNATYPEIIDAISQADANSNVQNIKMFVDSPGGEFAGFFDVVATMQSAKKPIDVTVGSVCASAAFGMASQANTISASNKASRIGSVGIVATIPLDTDVVEITSTEAPKKRPDVTTEEGRQMIREELDAMHELFADAIATGRNTTLDRVNAEFGQGGTFLAGEALRRGMIDTINGQSANLKTTASSGKTKEEASMTLDELKAQHPAVYAAAKQDGVNIERDRVGAHLTMGQSSGDINTAITACVDGVEMTQTLQAKYLSAGMDKRDVENRQDDEADNNITASHDSNSDSDRDTERSNKIMNMTLEKLGLESGGV